MTAVRDALRRAGVNAECYAGHSFRIGATTTAAARRLEDSTIQTLGVWHTWSTFASLDSSWQATQRG